MEILLVQPVLRTFRVPPININKPLAVAPATVSAQIALISQTVVLFIVPMELDLFVLDAFLVSI